MKRIIIIALAAIACITANAQEAEKTKPFSNLSAGVSFGTGGIGIEVGTDISSIISLRGGLEIMPSVAFTSHLNVTRPDDWYSLAPAIRDLYLPSDDVRVDFEGTLKMVNGNILADIYTSKNSMFHFTAGLYFGSSNPIIIKARGDVLRGVEEFNKDIDDHIPGLGTEKFTVDGYDLGIDMGRARIDVSTMSIKPYIGFGVGRTVPKSRIGCKFDFGVMFWGTPKLHDYYADRDFDSSYPGLGKDFHDAFNIVEKVKAYPTLKVTVIGKIL